MHRKAGEGYIHSKIRGHSIVMWNTLLVQTNTCKLYKILRFLVNIC